MRRAGAFQRVGAVATKGRRRRGTTSRRAGTVSARHVREKTLAPASSIPPPPANDTGAMGMNPFRPHRRSPADYVMVVAAFVVLAGLVFWAFHG